MRPNSSQDYHADATSLDPVFSGERCPASPIPMFFSDFKHLLFGQFHALKSYSRVPWFESCANRMLEIIRVRKVFKISVAIVYFDPVYVINLLFWWALSNESGSNEFLDSTFYRTAPVKKRREIIAIAATAQFQGSSLCRPTMIVSQPYQAAKIRDFIAILKSDDGPPLFLYFVKRKNSIDQVHTVYAPIVNGSDLVSGVLTYLRNLYHSTVYQPFLQPFQTGARV